MRSIMNRLFPLNKSHHLIVGAIIYLFVIFLWHHAFAIDYNEAKKIGVGIALTAAILWEVKGFINNKKILWLDSILDIVYTMSLVIAMYLLF